MRRTVSTDGYWRYVCFSCEEPGCEYVCGGFFAPHIPVEMVEQMAEPAVDAHVCAHMEQAVWG